jgi:hypothetical protein
VGPLLTKLTSGVEEEKWKLSQKYPTLKTWESHLGVSPMKLIFKIASACDTTPAVRP